MDWTQTTLIAYKSQTGICWKIRQLRFGQLNFNESLELVTTLLYTTNTQVSISNSRRNKYKKLPSLHPPNLLTKMGFGKQTALPKHRFIQFSKVHSKYMYSYLRTFSQQITRRRFWAIQEGLSEVQLNINLWPCFLGLSVDESWINSLLSTRF